MAEEKQQQDGQKTIVAFVVGLLIGGMLVWAFSGSPSETHEDNHEDTEETATDTSDDSSNTDQTSATTETEAPKLSVGDGKIVVNDQPASSAIVLESATYPVGEGWVGVRDFNNDELKHILGVVRFSESQGLVPSEISLLRPTVAGKKYAVVVYTENGDFDFNLANDVQIDTIYSTFTAQ